MILTFFIGEKSKTKLQSVAQAVACTSVDSSDKSFVLSKIVS